MYEDILKTVLLNERVICVGKPPFNTSNIIRLLISRSVLVNKTIVDLDTENEFTRKNIKIDDSINLSSYRNSNDLVKIITSLENNDKSYVICLNNSFAKTEAYNQVKNIIRSSKAVALHASGRNDYHIVQLAKENLYTA